MANKRNMKRRLTGHTRRYPEDTRLPAQYWVADYWDQFGVRHQHRFKKEQDAKNELIRALGKVQDGTYISTRDDITLAELARLYVDDLCGAVKGLERTTLKAYSCMINKHILPAFDNGNMMVREITQDLAATFQIELLNANKFPIAKGPGDFSGACWTKRYAAKGQRASPSMWLAWSDLSSETAGS
jgi:Phage integrase, N-terminal SAM-like domain